MTEHLFDTSRKFDKVYPEAKQRLKWHMKGLSSHNDHAAGR